MMMLDRRRFVKLALAGGVAFGAGCGRGTAGFAVGSKNFTEQLLLGEMLAQRVEAGCGAQVERRFYLAGSYVCHQALLAGRIDAYVEYSGTALTAILKLPPMAGHDAVLERVRSEYRQRFQCEVLQPLGFNNSFALVVRREDAQAQRLKAISDLARVASAMRLGVGYEFLERPDGLPGLARTYGLQFAAAPRVMDLGLLYRALESRQVDVIAGSNTDGLIAALGMMVLEDDRHYFPPYDAVPIVRSEALRRMPGAADAIASLAGRISADDMRRLNYAVDGQHHDAAEVARGYLASRHISPAPAAIRKICIQQFTA